MEALCHCHVDPHSCGRGDPSSLAPLAQLEAGSHWPEQEESLMDLVLCRLDPAESNNLVSLCRLPYILTLYFSFSIRPPLFFKKSQSNVRFVTRKREIEEIGV